MLCAMARGANGRKPLRSQGADGRQTGQVSSGTGCVQWIFTGRRADDLARPAMSGSASSSAPPLPRDAQLVTAVLRSMGVTEYEPRVLHQLLEFLHRYCTEVFHEGHMYAEHAGRSQIECEDVQLALRLKAAASQTGAASLIEWMARERNREPLPPAPTSAGVQLPPQRLCLLKVNYQLDAAEDQAGAAEDTAHPTTSVPQPPRRAKGALPISISLSGTSSKEKDTEDADMWE